jgi:kynurenine formamidase
MAEVSLDELVGDALVVHVPDAREREVIGWDRLNAAAGGLPGRVPAIVVVDTGWARWFRDPELRERHPALGEDAARELVSRGMRVLAVDALSPDPTGPPDGGFPVHDVVLGGDGLIVENLRGIESLAAVRLVLASRLGIERPEDHDAEDPRFGIYDWLGYRLDGLIRAVDGR